MHYCVLPFIDLPIDPVPINRSLFDLCFTICVNLPMSEQTNRAYGTCLSVKSLGNAPNSLHKVLMSSHLWYHAWLYITLQVFSERRSILVKDHSQHRLISTCTSHDPGKDGESEKRARIKERNQPTGKV